RLHRNANALVVVHEYRRHDDLSVLGHQLGATGRVEHGAATVVVDDDRVAYHDDADFGPALDRNRRLVDHAVQCADDDGDLQLVDDPAGWSVSHPSGQPVDDKLWRADVRAIRGFDRGADQRLLDHGHGRADHR